MNLLEIILGQIPEAIYFAMFMLLTKELKSKRLVFVIGMILEYILILNALPYSIWSYVLYFVVSFILLKLFYREASRGNYGAEQDSMRALECMLESVCDFMDMLERDAGSQEEAQMIKKYARKIGEM
jgi:hypothetical protein